ncbi:MULTISPECIES: hypothetical protein [Thioclava]|uniref:Uncharacterized protein n=1 Tax=Thioclava litoralis TaxID=3076557 RepID=A0ABZ1E3V3_9RHOB|nr:hypothetical protein RPE78_04970 [Thioclava sp. FTW29]
MKDDSALRTQSVDDHVPEQLLAFALEALLTRETGWVDLVPALARRFPHAEAVDIAIALTSAAAEIEHSFVPSSPSMDAARHGYKLAAVLMLEMHAQRLQGRPVRMAGDLLEMWHERPFLDLG